MTKMKKITALVLSAILLVTGTVAATVAYLSDTTQTIENTFTVGDIEITLAETTGTEYKMIPGNTITKDPKVTVEAGSEPCWLFVTVAKSTNFDNYLSFDMGAGWVELEDGVWYQQDPVDASSVAKEFPVILNNEVLVDAEALVDGVADQTVTFMAYAIQSANVTTPAQAWALLNP